MGGNVGIKLGKRKLGWRKVEGGGGGIGELKIWVEKVEGGGGGVIRGGELGEKEKESREREREGGRE